jgi:poly-gamma-glutamate synthesis protein (capsule biosynthesis protein)
MTMSDQVKLFLAGDAMLGRGIDQILPHPADPRLHEPVVGSAIRYVELAEAAHGAIERPVGFDYVWGEALAELERSRPDVRIVNLETAITTSDDHSPKGINYRMNPANAPCLTAAGIDCCGLANNHVLDWGRAGLEETLATLARIGIAAAGAGRDLAEARAPAIIAVGARARVLVFAFGLGDSGIPPNWAAAAGRAGVHRIPDLSQTTRERIAAQVSAAKRPGDVVVASIHWGGNWGYEVPAAQIAFAHGLIDAAGVDCVHGHSCHHVKGLEVHAGKLILYGCGDFIDDYEGIAGYEAFRDDLVLMYLPIIDTRDGRLLSLRMAPFRIRHLRLDRASGEEAEWLRDVLNREGRRFRTRVALRADRTLTLC